MALENTIAKYQIQVSKTGTGGTDAAADLKKASTAADSANKSLDGLNVTARSSSLAFRAVRSSMEAIGLTVMPQMVFATRAAREGFEALEHSGAKSAAQLAQTASIAIAVAAAVYEVTTSALNSKNAFKSVQEAQDSLAQDSSLVDKLRRDMTAMREAGEIINEQFRELQKALAKPEQINLTDWQTVLNKVGLATEEELKAFSESADKTKASIEAVTEALRRLKQVTVSPQAQLSALDMVAANSNAQAANTAAGRNAIISTYSGADKAADTLRVLDQYTEKLQLINELEKSRAITAEDAARLTIQAKTQEIQQFTAIKSHLTDIQVLEKQTAQLFASGLSTAIVDFASGTKNAKQAFQEFAASFLKDISKMILETEILVVIQKIAGLGAGSAGSVAAWNIPGGSAAGALLAPGGAKMMAMGGMVSAATYFPKFNTIAGEAGMEFLSVLARPRFMEVGGVAAVVGNMGNKRVALTDANELQNAGGAGGQFHIKVTMEEGLRAEIVSNSIKGAVHEVTNQMGQSGRLARVTRQATRSS